FFFQAEDGIRDFHVTGVQTCALPIYEKGVRLRATVSEFGPILLGKILGLNDTQEGIVSAIFKYCDDNELPLLDLKDFIKVLQYRSEERRVGKECRSRWSQDH